MKRQKIMALHMAPNAGGIGPQVVRSVRVGKDRADIFERDDDRAFIYVTFYPPKTLPLAQQRQLVQHYKVPLSQIAWLELEAPQDEKVPVSEPAGAANP